ncbi:hypothetical protein N431DRAFT_215376 [Stipitochalara longipes BDJ]|nr:hypothetical protein N431DRAFT_215376 [Stipitochalara longipes BDJ]
MHSLCSLGALGNAHLTFPSLCSNISRNLLFNSISLIPSARYSTSLPSPTSLCLIQGDSSFLLHLTQCCSSGLGKEGCNLILGCTICAAVVKEHFRPRI